MSKTTRANWTIVVALIVIVALVSILVFRPAAKVPAVSSTTTLPCQSPQLTTDLAIDECLETTIQTVTRHMDSSLRKESAYFDYASKAQDWLVAKKAQSTFRAYVREECLAQSHPYQSGTIASILFGECEWSLYAQRLHFIERALTSFRKGAEAQGTT